MASVGLSVYAISIQNKNDNENLILNNLQEGSFINIFKSFIDDYNGEYINSESLEKVFKTENYIEETYEEDNVHMFKYIIGKVKTGAYGYSAEIVNTSTGAVNYNRREDDAEVMPFFFCLCVPNINTTKALLILQTYGVFGIKTIFNNCLNEYIFRICESYKLNISSVTPTAYIQRFLENGILQKIRFLRYNIPHDRARQLGLNNGVEEAYEEYTIHKPLGFMQKNKMGITQFLSGQKSLNTVVEIKDFEYDNIKLDFKLGRKNKTINLSNIDKVIVNEDITDLVTLIDGHPTEESILPVLLETGRDYLNDMGFI